MSRSGDAALSRLDKEQFEKEVQHGAGKTQRRQGQEGQTATQAIDGGLILPHPIYDEVKAAHPNLSGDLP